MQVNLKVQVQIETIETLISSRKLGLERQASLRGCKLNKFNSEKLMKIRGEKFGLSVVISENKTRNKFDIAVNLGDILLLDFLQSST